MAPTVKYYSPTTSTWEEVYTSGEQGPTGPDGLAGPPGPAGGIDQAAIDGLYVNVAGDTMTGALTLAADPVAPMEAATKQYVDAGRTGRNKIINGDFSVNQRGFLEAPIYGLNIFSHDHWYATAQPAGGSGFITARATPLGDLPEGATSCAMLSSYDPVGPDHYVNLCQKIEDVGTLSGKQVTLSFWATTQQPTPMNLGAEFVQNFGTGGTPSASVFVRAGVVSVAPAADGWQRYSMTFDMPSIAGMVRGTDGNSRVTLTFYNSAGANTRFPDVGPQHCNMHIWGVQVEEGPVATQYEKKPYAQELLACRRYYQHYATVSGWVDAGPLPVPTTSNLVVCFPPDMYQLRAQPIATGTNIAYAYNGAVLQVPPTISANASTGEIFTYMTTDGVTPYHATSGSWVRWNGVVLNSEL